MTTVSNPYKPALRWNGLTRFYDRVMSITMQEDRFRSMLLEPVVGRYPRYVLDVGCGTDSQAFIFQRHFPKASVFGLNGDKEALTIARRKGVIAGQPVIFEQGLSTALPYPDQSIDLITCSLLLHHLSDSDKQQSIQEMWRVLTEEGSLTLADWGKPTNALMRLLFFGLQLVDVPFSQPSHATVYVAANLGTVQSVRTDAWRVFDVLWMLHTIDYNGRDDFNNGLLRAFSVLGLLTISSGFALYFISSPQRRKDKKARKGTLAYL